MAKKTLSQQLEEANGRIEGQRAEVAELKAENEKLKAELEAKPNDIHQMIDDVIDYFKGNRFYMRGVDSTKIESLIRSAREKLRIATKK